MISVIKSVSAGQDIYGNVSELLSMSTVSTHQAVNLTGKGIIVTARACDETIEAIELKDYPFGVGVQWLLNVCSALLLKCGHFFKNL